MTKQDQRPAGLELNLQGASSWHERAQNPEVVGREWGGRAGGKHLCGRRDVVWLEGYPTSSSTVRPRAEVPLLLFGGAPILEYPLSWEGEVVECLRAVRRGLRLLGLASHGCKSECGTDDAENGLFFHDYCIGGCLGSGGNFKSGHSRNMRSETPWNSVLKA